MLSQRYFGDGSTSEKREKEMLLEKRILELQNDYNNLKRNMEISIDKHKKLANSEMLKDMCEIVDSYFMFIETMNEDVYDGIFKELKVIMMQFFTLFKKHGAGIIIPDRGEEYDVHYMECVEITDTDNRLYDNKVSVINSVGCIVDDEVIKPAKVSVYKFKEKDKYEGWTKRLRFDL